MRPSEVKPKLDKFLLKKYKKVGEIPSDWSLKQSDDEKTTALNYQMRIRAAENCKKLDCVPTIYYGNNGAENVNKAFCIKGDCKLTIICFNEKLKKYIEDFLVEFFITHNFGRMQDKGFGSYVVSEIGNEKVNIDDKKIKKYLIENYDAKACYYISEYGADEVYPTINNCNKTICHVFDNIKDIYQVMKSGYNFRGYHHSVLFEYFHDLKTENGTNIRNEKAFIKKKGLTPRYRDENGQWNNDQAYYKVHRYTETSQKDNTSYRYVLAVLGLGETYTYQPN